MNLRTTTIVLVLAATLMGAAYADDAAMVNAKTRYVAAFKNGLGFFVREGDAQLKDGWAVSDVVPQAALGTFWVASRKKGVKIERLIASEEESVRTVPAISIPELLAANVGKRVILVSGTDKFEGQLLSIPDGKERQKPQQPSFLGNPQPNPYIRVDMNGSAIPNLGSVALLKTETGTLSINVSSIARFEVLEPMNTNTSYRERVKRLRFKVDGGGSNVPISMAYLQKGLMWSPAYYIELTDDKTARITAQGLLSNDVEDLDGADVSFVVGYPNFLYSDVQSPLALTQSVSTFVSNLYASESGARRSPQMYSSMANQSASYDSFGPAGPSSGLNYSTNVDTPGAQEEDLFLYNVKNVSLKLGERAYYTIFSADVPYEHIYELQIPDESNIDPRGYIQSNGSQEKRLDPQVWHELKFKNTSAYPWTTAPAVAVSNGNPLAQDRLDYTSKGGSGKLKLTVATDIKAKHTDIEKSRENNVVINHESLTKVTIDGTINLTSFKSKPVRVVVKRDVTGEVSPIGQGGKVERLGSGVRSINQTSEVTWDLELKPGEEKTLTYTYFVYVH